MFALASSAAVDLLAPGGETSDEVREMVVVAISGDKGELRSFSDYGVKQNRRQLNRNEIKRIRDFVDVENVDNLTPLVVPRIVAGKKIMIVGGTIHVFLHLNKSKCRRVVINNPPIRGEGETPPDDPGWQYTKVVEFFQKLKGMTD